MLGSSDNLKTEIEDGYPCFLQVSNGNHAQPGFGWNDANKEIATYNTYSFNPYFIAVDDQEVGDVFYVTAVTFFEPNVDI